MSSKFSKIVVILLAGIAVIGLIVVMRSKEKPSAMPVTNDNASNALPVTDEQKSSAKVQPLRKGRVRFGDFSDQERREFPIIFKSRLKPALNKWCKAYSGHIPFNADAVTVDKFVERLGMDSSFYDYTFVVNGVTITIADAHKMSCVDYVNDPRQTQQLMDIPQAQGKVPITSLPVSRAEVSQMVSLDSNVHFDDGDIRMIPSGVSSAMNGGAHVEVGGEPNNFLSWNYTLVFAPNGNLAYYCKGPDKK